MELKCPQCGKWMAVSQEELVIHDCQVVCPQCLAVCHYEGNTLVVRNDSDAPYRYNVSVEPTTQHDSSRFCHSCGKQLPSGISFCPYCGADLNAPFDNAAQSQPAATKPQPAPQPQPAATKPQSAPQPQPASKPQRAGESKSSQPEPQPEPRREQRSSSSTPVQDKLRSMAPHYSDMHPRLHQNGTMPGTAFKIFAYAAIIILLALLAYIIFAGASIDIPA